MSKGFVDIEETDGYEEGDEQIPLKELLKNPEGAVKVMEHLGETTRGLRKLLEIIILGFLVFGTLIIVLMSHMWAVPVMIILIVVSSSILYLFSRLKRVYPIYGYFTLWLYWIIHSFFYYYYVPHGANEESLHIGSQYGATGLTGVVASILLYTPIALISSFDFPKFIGSRRKYFLFGLMVLAAAVPVQSGNIFRVSIVNTLLRTTASASIYMTMIYRYDYIGEQVHSKYGIAVALDIMYVFFADIYIMIMTFGIQFSWMLYTFFKAVYNSIRKPSKRSNHIPFIIDDSSDESHNSGTDLG